MERIRRPDFGGLFFLFDREQYVTLAASVIGVTSLIFNAKGNPFGQILIIVFSLLYGYISYTSSYYGEMITYLGMTAPMAVIALVSWLRNPFNGEQSRGGGQPSEGERGCPDAFADCGSYRDFYFILAAFHTANLIPSTVSVTTSFWPSI